jgi:hypothetical protein
MFIDLEPYLVCLHTYVSLVSRQQYHVFTKFMFIDLEPYLVCLHTYVSLVSRQQYHLFTLCMILTCVIFLFDFNKNFFTTLLS